MTNQDRTWWESGLWPIMRYIRHERTHAQQHVHIMQIKTRKQCILALEPPRRILKRMLPS